MGVQDFGTLVKKYAPLAERSIKLSDMSGYTIAIDMNWLTHSERSIAFDIATRDIDLLTQPVDDKMVNAITIEHILAKILKFLQHGITIVAVFDGKKHWLKSDEYCNPKRIEDRQKRVQSYQELRDEYQAKGPFGMDPKRLASYENAIKANHPFDYQIYQDLEQIIRAFGVPVVKADEVPVETNDAEGVCAFLCRFHGCTMGYTTDSDYHVYGGEWQITNIEKGVCTVRCLTDILGQLEMTYEQLVDVCILMGNDFNARVPRKTGVANSIKEIRTKGSFLNCKFVNEPNFHWYHYIVNLYTSTTKPVESLQINTAITWSALTTAHENATVQRYQLSNYVPRFQACQKMFQ